MTADGLSEVAASLELPADMDHWDELFGFVQAEAQRHLQGNAKEYGLTLACEELLSNIIRYNPSTSPDGQPMLIRIDSGLLAGSPQRFQLRISYNNVPFDPQFESLSTSVDDTAIESRKIGGLGLFLIKNSVDHVNYQFSDPLNIYTVDTELS